MTSVRLDPSSQKAVWRIRNLRKLTKAGIEYAAWQSAKQLQKATSDEIIRKPKRGRTYIIRGPSGRRRRHVASAPGETHANLTGKLRRSLGFTVSSTEIEFGYGVFREPAPEYARFVEFGTRRMLARPSLLNGIRDQRRNFQTNFDRQIGKRLGDRVLK